MTRKEEKKMMKEEYTSSSPLSIWLRLTDEMMKITH